MTNLPLLTDAQIASLKGETLMFDSEFYKNFDMIGFQHTTGIIDLRWPFDCDKLLWIMHNFRTVGFYSNRFDLPMVFYAATGANQEELFSATQQLVYQNTWPAEFAKERNFTLPTVNSIDLLPVAPLTGSLKLYAARLHAKRIQDLPFDPSLDLSPEQAEIVANYCLHSDLPATRLLWENLAEQITLREELTAQYGTDLRSKSDAQIAESVIGSEIKRITGRWPKKPGITLKSVTYKPPAWIAFQTPQLQAVLETISQAQFIIDANGSPVAPPQVRNLLIPMGNSVYQVGIGGLHSCEEKVAHRASADHKLFDIDFASYYPKIITNNNFIPTELGENFLTVYKRLLDRRLMAKANKNFAEAEGLKVSINGAFGKLGSQFSILYAPDLLVQVTLTGQLCLLMFIEALEGAGIPVVSANTDGIVVKCPAEAVPTLDQITKWIEGVTGFETERTEYDGIFSANVNNYLALKKDGTFKGKGLYADPWEGGKKEAIFRFHVNPVNTICIEAAKRKIRDGIPPAETIRNCTTLTRFTSIRNAKNGANHNGRYLGKTVRWYHAIDENDCLRTNDGHKVADSDGAKPCMILPDTFPLDIDYEKYEKETANILEDIGYTKRLTLFDLIEG